MKSTRKGLQRVGVAVLAGLLLLVALAGPAQGTLSRNRQPPSSEFSNNAVRIPALGSNPWAIDSILGTKQGLSGGLNGKGSELQKEMLKNWAEQQKAKLTPEQKRMFEGIMKNVGNGKGPDREKWKQMLEKLFPEGESAAKDQLKNLLNSENFNKGSDASAEGENEGGANGQGTGAGGSRLADPETLDPGATNQGVGQKEAEKANLQGGPGGGPEGQPGAEPGATQEFGPNKFAGNRPLPVPPFARDAAGKDSLMNSPAVSSSAADRALKSLLPLGLDQWAKPSAKKFAEWASKWSTNLKLPKGMSDEIKRTFSQIKLPTGAALPSAPRLPNAPSVSIPKPESLVYFVAGGVVIGVLIWLMLKKFGVGSAEGFLAAFRTTGKGDDLIGALESAVLRLGGEKGATGNHLLWKTEVAPVMAQRGLAPETIERIFDHYVWRKYRGLPLDQDKETQAIADLHRI